MDFVKKWLEDQGAEGVYIDEAKNVIYPVDIDSHDDIVVVMAQYGHCFP